MSNSNVADISALESLQHQAHASMGMSVGMAVFNATFKVVDSKILDMDYAPHKRIVEKYKSDFKKAEKALKDARAKYPAIKRRFDSSMKSGVGEDERRGAEFALNGVIKERDDSLGLLKQGEQILLRDCGIRATSSELKKDSW